MKIIGLSGGVASGKNFVAEIFANNGADIFDADKETHKLLELDESTIYEIAKEFPQAFIDKKINRKILGENVFSNKNKLEILEKIIHPKIRQKYHEFLNNSKANLVVLNIPLLLDKEGYDCDYVIALIAPKNIKKERFLQRHLNEGSREFLEEKFEKIFNNQIDDEIRKLKSNFIIDSSKSKQEVERQVLEILENI
jgi:dephospho-CoA kinase